MLKQMLPFVYILVHIEINYPDNRMDGTLKSSKT
jgi:hypothetical protein